MPRRSTTRRQGRSRQPPTTRRATSRGARQRLDAGKPDERAFAEGPTAALDRFAERTGIEAQFDRAIAIALYSRQLAALVRRIDDMAECARRAQRELERFNLTLGMPDGFSAPAEARHIGSLLPTSVQAALDDAITSLREVARWQETLLVADALYHRQPSRPQDLTNRAFAFTLDHFWQKEGRKALNGTDLALLARGCGFEGKGDNLIDEEAAPDELDGTPANPTPTTSRDFDAERRIWKDRLREARRVKLDLGDHRTVEPVTVAVYLIEKLLADERDAAKDTGPGVE